ncbi:3'-phosphoesterase [Streptomyces sp. NBC_01387]|uniref:DNA polymerase ligase N-terminal domain-containing protein n=1 Tax=unclassified Streptomyces TaxID=2593676 RepID=UPI0022576EDC|nr:MULTISPECIES: DNA polymerase ligase N-terminal domain-containing protein [unclassified Streptomyces]MCX4552723.1 3'-phosphoesterase [Streptomyces sp. NBC_01500]WSC24061.1 3'-phosphoesterase [Streptomyces sp. NBC_01766]
MSDEEALRTYRGKRHFDTTSEPRGETGGSGDAPCFVVQIHDARRMHFDFRLEVAGVLKSWAVPKGPSADPRDKRLAVPTEDHPLEYREFEGVIPRGEYGGGTVIVWDEGTYRPLSHDRRGRGIPFAESLERGHATFWLDGTKLHGEYALTRFHGGADSTDPEAWLLVKAREKTGKERSAPAEARDGSTSHGTGKERTGGSAGPTDPRRARSVRTGRTLQEVADGAAAQDEER